MGEEAWKLSVEEGKVERTAQVNKLIETVKDMEVKQLEIKQNMEYICEQTQEKYQRSVKTMQDEYQRKLEQEVQ